MNNTKQCDQSTGTVPEKFYNILQYLNCKYESIKFTMCIAEQSKLQFLDMVVISDQQGNAITRIYHKPIGTGLYS